MKNLILLLFTCAVFSSSFSQPMFMGKRSLTDSLREAGDLNGVIAEFRKEFIKDAKNKTLVYNYACALSLDSQIDSAFKYLNIALELDATSATMVDPDFINIRESKKWSGIEDKLISLLERKNKSSFKDVDFMKALWRFKAYDQAYFYEIGVAVRKLGFTSPIVVALQKLKSLYNERNVSELEILLSKNGWPKNSEVGTDATSAAFYVIQHSTADKKEKYLPLLKKRCEENEASWIHYAMMYDRMKMNQNLPQRYGTQANLDNRATGGFELYTLEDKTKVNDWRKEVGLPPLKNVDRK